MKIFIAIVLLPFFLTAALDKERNVITGPEKIFFRNENKTISLDSPKNRVADLCFYRISKPLDYIADHKMNGLSEEEQEKVVSSQPAINEFLSQYFTGFSADATKRYGLEKDFFFTIKNCSDFMKVFLPLQQTGLYLVESILGGQKKSFIVNVSDLALLVKRDRMQTLVCAYNRETGAIIKNAILNGEGLDFKPGQKNQLKTDDNGLLNLRNSSFSKYGLITGSWSNSIDVVHADSFSFHTNGLYKPVSLPERRCYHPGEDMIVYSVFYKLDMFKDYQAVQEGSFGIGFLNEPFLQSEILGTVTKSVLHIPESAPEGLYKLVTTYQNAFWTNQVYVLGNEEKDLIVDIKPGQSSYHNGELVHGKINISSIGLKPIEQSLLSWRAYAFDNDNGKLLYRTQEKTFSKTGNIHFSVPTRHLSKKEISILIEALIRTADGKTTHSFEEVLLSPSDEKISLEAEKHIIQAGDNLNIKVVIQDKKNPYQLKKTAISIISTGPKEHILQSFIIETKSTVTNILVSPSGTGKIVIRARDRKNPSIYGETEMWIVPETGDLKLDDPVKDFLVISDRSDYSFGDIAKILVISARKGINALMTFEGEDIHVHENLFFNNNFQVVDVPIIERNKPNSLILVQTIVSNKLLEKSLNIPVPYRNKKIIYHINPVLEKNDKFRLETDNIWGRTVKTFSIISFGNRSIILDRNNTALERYLYPLSYPGVISYFNFPIRHQIEDNPDFSINIPWQKGDLLEPQNREKTSVIENSSTNIFTVTGDESYNSAYLACRVRSLTADGKTGLFIRNFNSDEPLEFKALIPAYFRAGDQPVLTYYIRNHSKRAQEVRLRTEMFNGNMLFYLTNRILINGEKSRSYKIKIPNSSLSGADFFKIAFNYWTPINKGRLESIVPIEKAIPNSANRGYFKFSRTFRKLFILPSGRTLSLFPGNRFNVEDIILITLRIHVPEGITARNGYKFYDAVPSGFIPVKDMISKGQINTPLKEDNNTSEPGYVAFPFEQEGHTMVLRYFLRARVPGTYSLLPDFILLPDGQRLVSNHLAGPEKTVKIVF